mmetsp:Transcript_36201/g.47745  ORF Transcript_36201/g.47745 Transcript_36201/m.47745 type:complete len:145 (-) Transcript_36201:294-728(-)
MEERLNSQKKPVLEGEDLRRIADVRRDVWTGGFRGLISGLFLGSASYLLLRKFRPSSFPSTYIDDSKYYILSTLSLGSVGSFMGSLVAGKNSIVFVSDIFQRGAVKNPTAYQETVLQRGTEEIPHSETEVVSPDNKLQKQNKFF